MSLPVEQPESETRYAGTPATWRRLFIRAQRELTRNPNAPGPDVPCNGCTACCENGYPVDLSAEEAARLDHMWHPDDPETPILRQTESGACVYLGEHGCTIHAERPLACRAWDCRAFFFTGIPIEHAGGAEQRWRTEYKTPEDRFVAKAMDVGAYLAAKDHPEWGAERCALAGILAPDVLPPEILSCR